MRILSQCMLISLLLMGCANAADPSHMPIERTKEQIKFSTVQNKKGTDQQPANKAKENISSVDELTNIYAVNSTNILLVGIDVAHHHRLQLKEIRKTIKMRLEKEFPHFELHISSDKKIQQELETLEKNLQKNNITSFDLEQKVDEILSLSKEQT